MKNGRALLVLGFAGVLGWGAVHAAVYKCALGKGFIYQDRRCDTHSAQQGVVHLPDNKVELHTNEVENVLESFRQKEAAEDRARELANPKAAAQARLQSAQQHLTKKAVASKLGEPDHCNVTSVAGKTSEQCVYGKGARASYVYFENGIANGVQYTTK